jgi:hypothetical protein
MDSVLAHAGERIGAAGDVDLSVDHGRGGGAAPRGHRRKLLPFIGGGIVFPGIVDRVPAGRAGLRIGEAAEGVDLVVQCGECDVMGRKSHRLLLGPLVGRRVVFVNHRLRLPAGRETAEDVKLAPSGCAEHLLGGVREGRALDPGISCSRSCRSGSLGEGRRSERRGCQQHATQVPGT